MLVEGIAFVIVTAGVLGILAVLRRSQNRELNKAAEIVNAYHTANPLPIREPGETWKSYEATRTNPDEDQKFADQVRWNGEGK